MRSHEDLLMASGYTGRPREFEELLRILDGELRLITPTEPEWVAGGAEWMAGGGCRMMKREDREEPHNATASSPATRHPPPATLFYQLTHDYLVPALRSWLARKQKETRRGRAELQLAERAAAWNAKPAARNLPAWWEWASIRLFTSPRDWTALQRQMMRKATRFHVLRGLALVCFLACLAWGSWEEYGTLKAHALRDRLLNANAADLPVIIGDMAPYRPWLNPLLREVQHDAVSSHDGRRQLYTSLALLPVDPSETNYLSEQLLKVKPQELPVLRDALLPYKDGMLDRLWAVVEQPARDKPGERLRAACALALYDPNSPRWNKACALVVDQLVSENPVYLGIWLEGFRPIKDKLLTPLMAVFRDRKPERSTERSMATNILADYAADHVDVLADLVMDAQEKQFAILFPRLKSQGQSGQELLIQELDRTLPSKADDEAREQLAKRQANAAVALLRMRQPERAWPLLRQCPDPRVRTYLVHRFGPFGSDPGVLVQRFQEEKDASVRRGLLLALGEFRAPEVPADQRTTLLPKLLALYRQDPDPGIHGCLAWLMRQWGQSDTLQQLDQELATSQVKGDRRWYVNHEGQTFVVIPGPVEFAMGSPSTEAGRAGDERLHRQRISRTFALAATHVTVAQFKRFRPQFGHGEMKRYPDPDCPIGGVTWHEAAAYCNWLSKEEGIPEDQWCYVSKPEGAAGGSMQLAPGYLHRTGYRLPTEAEWECACRAGTMTSRFYGQSEEMLEKYGWYAKNSGKRTWPVGSLKPNDWGLFDMHGQLFAWCQEKTHDYRSVPSDQVIEDTEEELVVNDRDGRVARGGSLFYPAEGVR